MSPEPKPETDFDWEAATWEGNRRRQMVGWTEMSLDDIFAAQEAMAELAQELADAPAVGKQASGGAPVAEE